jgi:hypothetical protein
MLGMVWLCALTGCYLFYGQYEVWSYKRYGLHKMTATEIADWAIEQTNPNLVDEAITAISHYGTGSPENVHNPRGFAYPVHTREAIACLDMLYERASTGWPELSWPTGEAKITRLSGRQYTPQESVRRYLIVTVVDIAMSRRVSPECRIRAKQSFLRMKPGTRDITFAAWQHSADQLQTREQREGWDQ